MSRANDVLHGLWEARFGDRGIEVERAFVEVSNRIGLSSVVSPPSGKMWDIQVQSGPWNRYLFGKPINIKNYKGKFLFWSAEVAHSLPWDGGSLPVKYNTHKAEIEIYQLIQKKRLPEIVFLKPSSLEAEDKLLKLATPGVDLLEIAYFFQDKKNWLTHMLGPRFGIHINLNEKEKRVSSVVIVQPSGVVFGMSEKPRGGRVQFRHNKSTKYSSIGYQATPIMV